MERQGVAVRPAVNRVEMMTHVQFDPALQQKLGGVSEPLALCDRSGNVLGRYIPEAEYKKMLYASFKIPHSDEEIARLRA